MVTANKLISKTEKYIGYLEKKNGDEKYLTFDADVFRQNPGSANYTCFGKWYGTLTGVGNPNAWCAFFVSRIMYEACDEDLSKTREMLCGGLFSYTPAGASQFQNKGQWYTKDPQAGDIIFFQNTQRICHVGIVYKVDSSYVYTIEGNTSGGSEVNANGGGVHKKSYLKTNSRIAGYGRPMYDTEPKEITEAADTAVKAVLSSEETEVKNYQDWLNRYLSNSKFRLSVDGVCGPAAKKASITAIQHYLNITYKAGLAEDGSFGPRSKSSYSSAIGSFKRGSSGDGVRVIQGLLYGHGFDPNGFDGKFGPGMEAAVKAFQQANGLAVDGRAGKHTFGCLVQ